MTLHTKSCNWVLVVSPKCLLLSTSPNQRSYNLTLTNGVASYTCCKFWFEEGCYVQIIQMPQLLATTCQKNMGSFNEIIM